MMTMMKRTSKGRKKIEIEKIKEVNSRQVTFSKRRNGFFNKATELCVLTEAETSIIVQSEGGRLFAFGHPNFEAVVDRYLNGTRPQKRATASGTKPEAMHAKFNKVYAEISKELKAEKDRWCAIVGEKNMEEGGEPSSFWWDESYEDMGLEDLDKYIKAMEELKKNIKMSLDEYEMLKASSFMSQEKKNRDG